MAVSMRDLDSAFQGAGQKAYPLFDKIWSIFELSLFTNEILFRELHFLKVLISFNVACILVALLKGCELLLPPVLILDRYSFQLIYLCKTISLTNIVDLKYGGLKTFVLFLCRSPLMENFLWGTPM